MSQGRYLGPYAYLNAEESIWWNIPHIIFIVIAICLFVGVIIHIIVHRPLNGWMHVLCAGGLTLLMLVRGLSFLGVGSHTTLMVWGVVGELVIAAGIFSIRPEPSMNQSKPFRSLSGLSRMTLLLNLGVVVALLVLGFAAIELGGFPGRKGAMEMLMIFLVTIPILVALAYQAVRHLRMR